MIRLLLRRTLVRRVTLALAGAYVLVFAVFMGNALYLQRTDVVVDRQMLGWAPGVVQSLESVSEPARAHEVGQRTDYTLNANRRALQLPGAALIQITDRRDGRLAYSSPEAGAMRLQGPPDGKSWVAPNGDVFRVFQGETPRWSMRIAAPVMSRAWLWSRIWPELLKQMAMAFAIVLPVVCFAVLRGLRPLQRLSDLIAARGSKDLSALSYDPKYEELKPLVHSLDQLMARLRQNVEREHAFVQDAAHELRTPMAVISAQAHVLAMAASSEERREAEQRMDRAIGRASHLIEQLLSLADVDREIAHGAVTVDVAQVVRQALAQSAPAAMARGIEISLDAADVLPFAVERHAFESVLHNLLDNAIRYGREGGRVEVALQLADGMLHLSVADDGPGIPVHERGLVFERFYRGAANEATGSGLGLAIVGQAVAHLKGEVRLGDGLEGRGCCFAVTIPVAAAAGGLLPAT